MRVSMFNKFDVTKYYLNKLQNDVNQKQVQISTGKSFQRLSEEPVKANQSLMIKTAQLQIEQFQKNISDTDGFLSKVENVLGSVIDTVQSARSEAIKASNDTSNQQDRETYATMIDQMISQVVGYANTKHFNRFIFSGTMTQNEAFTYDGVTSTYNGNNEVPNIYVSTNLAIKTSFAGNEVFGDIINTMINLRDEVRAGNAGNITGAIEQVDLALEKVIDARSEVGTRMNTVETLKSNYDEQYLVLAEKNRDVTEVNIADVIMEFSNSQKLFQATIQSTTKMFEVSLLNYI